MQAPVWVPWLIALLGAACAVPVTRWLQWVTYRKPDEQDLPLPGGRWWVVPALGLSWGLIAHRVLLVPHSSDPGASTTQVAWVEGVVLATLLVVALACVCLAAMDMDVQRLPDRVMWPTLGTLLVGLLVAAIIALDLWPWGRVLLAALACGGFYLALALASLARGSIALGLGDVKLAALLGAGLGWFGWWEVAIGLYAGFVVGGLWAVALLAARRVGLRSHFAFGPPMMVGALAGLILSPDTVSLW